jgi:hypothetical protein
MEGSHYYGKKPSWRPMVFLVRLSNIFKEKQIEYSCGKKINKVGHKEI